MAHWYYSNGVDEFGPLDEPSLRRLKEQGELTSANLLWRKGLASWVNAGQETWLFPDLVHRIEKCVVIDDGGTLPARCIKCKCAVADKPLQITFVDSETGGAPRSRLIGAAVHFATRRTAKVNVSMCPRHRAMWKGTGILGLIMLLIPLGLMVAILGSQRGMYLWRLPPPVLAKSNADILGRVMLGTFVAGFLLAQYRRFSLNARINDGEVFLKGAGKSFLASIPEKAAAADPAEK